MSKLIERVDGEGWIYILMTPSDYNRVKIGMTKRNPLLRLRDLKTGDPYLALQAAYFIPTNFGLRLLDIENLIHVQLEHLRIHFLDDEDQVKKPSEWFTMDCRDSVRIVNNAINAGGYKITNDTSGLNVLEDYTAIQYFEADLIYDPCPFALSFNNYS
ncbi:TPA: GIY-YIG nuclease family protein [Vibrio parahaemolyticus]|nr:GIY-YIG nuclease family protein [Vibrio parahaemolyticus]HCE4545017.1 GIY-YIG nuclease family protein [Vibrio parahaemolyticus]